MIPGFRTHATKCYHFLGRDVRRLLLISVFLGIFWFLVEAAFVFVFQGMIASIGLVDRTNLHLPDWYPVSETTAVFIFLGFGTIRAALYWAREYFSGVTCQAFMERLRGVVFRRGVFDAEIVPHSETITVFSNRIGEAGALMQQASQFVTTFTAASLLLAYAFHLAPITLILGVTALGLAMIPLKAFSGAIQYLGNELVRISLEMNDLLVRTLKNNFLMRAYGLLPREINRADLTFRAFSKNQNKYYLFSGFRSSYTFFVGVVIVCIITLVSSRYDSIPPAVLVSFLYLFLRLSQTASEANSALAAVLLGRPGFKVLYEWYSRDQNGVGIDNSFSFGLQKKEELSARSKAQLEGQNLAFSYNLDKKLFQNLNFTVKEGEILLIQGPSGVGKSTLLKIILGLINPTSGKLLINGTPAVQMRSYLSLNLAYVGPDPFLFAGSLRENLLYGHLNPESVTDEEIFYSLSQVQIDPEASSVVKDLNRRISDHSVFSTGQRQRIAIARALLRKPNLLVLDEATANLDIETESTLLSAVEPIIRGTTCVIVSHRQTIRSIATHIISLDAQQR